MNLKTINNMWKIIGISIIAILAVIILSFAFGWTDVFYTKTVGKAKENANREVYESTNSYTRAKILALGKFHHEWVNANDQDKKSIEFTVRQEFADFDNELVKDLTMYTWLVTIKNK